MASKFILDTPVILEENMIPLMEACQHFPVLCSRAAIERWARQGSRGVVLETVLVCGRRYTSTEAIDRFVRNQLHVEQEKARANRGSKSKKDIAEAAKRFGLPEPEPRQGINE
jgi:hypothetical protein